MAAFTRSLVEFTLTTGYPSVKVDQTVFSLALVTVHDWWAMMIHHYTLRDFFPASPSLCAVNWINGSFDLVEFITL